MYSPTLGRFVTKDPIGFQAGDVNLYRFVENDPANRTDPTGLGPIPFPEKLGTIGDSIENEKATNARLLTREAAGKLGGGRGSYLGPGAPPGYKQATPGVIPEANRAAAGGPGTNINGGFHAFFGLPRGDDLKYFGTGGCQGCVGLIVVCDRGAGAVFHFAAFDNPAYTLAKYDWPDTGKCKAYVFGGDQEAGSKGLFNEVLALARDTFDPRYTYIVDSDQLLVGYDGKIYVRPPVKK